MQRFVSLFHLRVGSNLLLASLFVFFWYSASSAFLSSQVIQSGQEFGIHIAPLFAWEHFKTCGVCALWENNSGGAPIFGDVYSAAQHPFVILAVLLTDPITAANATVAFAIALMGLSAVLYARMYAYEVIPTIWLMALLMWGAHIMARLNVGTIALPLSIASYTLCTVLWLRWAYAPGRTTMLLVAVGTASLGLSGQGYMQLMFLMSLIPIFVFAKRRMPTSQIVRTVAVVGAVTVLLMLPFFVSYLLNGHLMHKHGNLDLDTVQPFGYFVMNLVVDQREFFESSLLTKQPFVYLYSNYVGHVTVILATIAVYARFLRGDVTTPVTAPTHQDSPQHESQSVLLWVGLITISALLVSGMLQRALLWLDVTLLSEFVAYLRNVVIVGCVVAIAAIFLSGYGLRIVLAHLGQIRGSTPMRRTVNVVSTQIVLCLILGWQALNVRDYAQSFVAFDERDTNVAAAMEFLEEYPLGYVMSESNYQYLYILDSTHKNVWNLFYPFQYKNSVNLEAAYRIAYTPIEPNEGWRELSRFGDLHLYMRDGMASAYTTLRAIQQDAAPMCPVQSGSLAGRIELTCTLNQADTLIVREYFFPGWRVSVDGQPVPLVDDLFLAVDVSAGVHTIVFEYLPVAVIVSALISTTAWVVVMGVMLYGMMTARIPRSFLSSSHRNSHESP